MSQSPKCITVPGFVQVSSSPSTWLLDHHVPTPSRPHSHHLAGSCMEPKHHSPAGRSPSWETQATEVIQKSYRSHTMEHHGTSVGMVENGWQLLDTFGTYPCAPIPHGLDMLQWKIMKTWKHGTPWTAEEHETWKNLKHRNLGNLHDLDIQRLSSRISAVPWLYRSSLGLHRSHCKICKHSKYSKYSKPDLTGSNRSLLCLRLSASWGSSFL